MVSITNSGTISVEDNTIQNLTSEMGIELHNVMFVTALDNDMSGMDVAFSIDQTSMTLTDATFEGNSFSDINDLAIPALIPMEMVGQMSSISARVITMRLM